MWEKIKQFLREVSIELKKVTFPTRKETLATTSILLVFTVIVAAYLGAVDMILSKLIKLVLE